MFNYLSQKQVTDLMLLDTFEKMTKDKKYTITKVEAIEFGYIRDFTCKIMGSFLWIPRQFTKPQHILKSKEYWNAHEDNRCGSNRQYPS